MSDFHFLAVLLNTSDRRDVSDIVDQLNRARDWVEFQDHSWLVWTQQSSKTWYRRIKPHLQKGDNLLVFAANLDDRGGLMPEAFWEFVRAKSG